jgi:hypothetical protein
LTVQGTGSTINTTSAQTGSSSVTATNGLGVHNGGLIDLANAGTATVAGGKVNVDTTGVVSFENGNNAYVTAGTTLDVGNASGTVSDAGTITATNIGDFNVLAGTNLTVQGVNSKISANNSNATRSVGATIAAAKAFLLEKLGVVSLANKGDAAVTAGTTLDVGNATDAASDAGTITATNTGNFNILSGSNLTVQGANSKITANNATGVATIGAGSKSVTEASTTGGNLTVKSAGGIEKLSGSGDFILAAHKAGGIGGKLVVEDSGSNITAKNTGNLIITADAQLSNSAKESEQFTNPSDKQQYAFRVSDGGVVNKNNTGTMKVTAQTVYLGGLSAVNGTTNGSIDFASADSKGFNGYFKMQDSMIANVGAVTLSDYTLNLDPSGIKSNTAITLNIYNPDQIVFPDVLIGLGKTGSGKNFLDAPSNDKILINGIIPPTQQIKNVSGDIAGVMVNNAIVPQLPKNPCDGSNQSTLNSKGVANYIPEVSAQVPYSVLTSTSGQTASPSAALTTPLVLAMLDDSVECH